MQLAVSLPIALFFPFSSGAELDWGNSGISRQFIGITVYA